MNACSEREDLFFEDVAPWDDVHAHLIADPGNEVREYSAENITAVSNYYPVLTPPPMCTATPGPTPTWLPFPRIGESVELALSEPPDSCERIKLTASFTATGIAGPITASRTRLDTYTNCAHAEERIAASPWAAFEPTVPFAIAGGPRVYAAALVAQYRDAAGNLSAVVCAEAYGLCPDAPTETPAPVVERRRH